MRKSNRTTTSHRKRWKKRGFCTTGTFIHTLKLNLSCINALCLKTRNVFHCSSKRKCIAMNGVKGCEHCCRFAQNNVSQLCLLLATGNKLSWTLSVYNSTWQQIQTFARPTAVTRPKQGLQTDRITIRAAFHKAANTLISLHKAAEETLQPGGLPPVLTHTQRSGRPADAGGDRTRPGGATRTPFPPALRPSVPAHGARPAPPARRTHLRPAAGPARHRRPPRANKAGSHWAARCSRRFPPPVRRRRAEMMAAGGGAARGEGVAATTGTTGTTGTSTSFRRSGGSRLAAVPGTRPALRHGRLLISCGVPSLDCVLGWWSGTQRRRPCGLPRPGGLCLRGAGRGERGNGPSRPVTRGGNSGSDLRWRSAARALCRV